MVDHAINCGVCGVVPLVRQRNRGPRRARAHDRLRGPEAHRRAAVTLADTFEIRTGDVEIADEFDKTSDPKTKNGQTIAIRRSSCEKVLTIWSPGEQWNVYLQPLDIRTSPCTVS